MASTLNASTSSGLISSGDTSGVLQLQTANTTALTVDTSANVGIGTTSPTNKLHVQSVNSEAINVSDSAAGGNAQIKFSGSRTYQVGVGNASSGFAGSLYFYDATAGAERMRIDSSGNVGIGITSPAVKLDVGGNGQFTASSSQISFIDSSNSNYKWSIQGTSSAIRFYDNTASAERMRIDSSGNLLVGTTSAGAGVGVNTKLAVDAGSIDGAVFKVSGGVGFAPLIAWNTATSGNNTFASFSTEGGTGTQRGTITYNRGAGVVAYNVTSDYRAKTIDGNIENALNEINAIKTHKATMKDGTISMPMFVAHELAETAPYCVTGEKDAVDGDGKPKYQQVDSSPLIPLLVKAIQELNAKVDTQAETINALTARIVALEQKGTV